MSTALVEVIEEEAAVPLHELGASGLHERVVARAAESARLAALEAADLAVWEASGDWRDDGSRSAAARLARDARISRAEARVLVRRARRLAWMPVTFEAFAAGRLSVAHVDLLVSVNRSPYEVLFRRDEAVLVGQALNLSFEDFARAVAYWVQCADDVAAEDRAERDRARRRASVARGSRGRRHVEAELDPIGGAIFEAELVRLERAYFEEDWAEAKDRWGDDVTLDRLRRTSAQRRHDALVEMAIRSAAMPADAKRGRILLSVLVGYETFAGRLCELLDGTVIAPGQIVPHLSLVDIERVVFDGPSRVLDVGRQVPFFTGALRRAIEVRDRGCTFPGCDVPAERCDVDHVVERCSGGDTTQDNGRLLCGVHNRQRPGRAGHGDRGSTDRAGGGRPRSGGDPDDEDPDRP